MPSGFEIEGRLAGRLDAQTGRSSKGDWVRQDFILEVADGTFPTSICFSLWGADRVKELEKFPDGAQVKVSFNLSSRQYNGKWFTDVRAWRVSAAGTAAAPAQVPMPTAPPPTVEDIPAEDFGEDLPF